MTIYRLCHEKYDPRSGTGAARYGGRWNPPGREAVYAASSRALAALEVLVHHAALPQGLVCTTITVPPGLGVADGFERPTPFSPPNPRESGKRWLDGGRTAVLCAPSVVVPDEDIFILNPNHPDFQLLGFAKSRPFNFDERLK